MIRKLLGDTDPYCDELIRFLWRSETETWGTELFLYNNRPMELRVALDGVDERGVLFTRFKPRQWRASRKAIPVEDVISHFKVGNEEKRLETIILDSVNFKSKTKYDIKAWLKLSRDQKLEEIGLPSYDGNLLEIVPLLWPRIIKPDPGPYPRK